MASRIKVLPDAPERGLQSDVFKDVIERIEVGGVHVDWIRQAQAADVLQQEADIQASAIAFGHRQHLRGAINTKDRHTPTLAQVASKEPGAAADVRDGAKSYIVPLDECFEGSTCSNEVRYAKGDVIG